MATTTIKDGYNGGSDNQLKVNPDGSINVDVTGGGAGSNVNLVSVGGSSITLGQNTEANSIPVTIASNQSPIPVTGSITATNPSVGADGSVAPDYSTLIGGINPSGNLQGLLVDSSGLLEVNAGQIFGVQNLRVLYNEVNSIAVGVETTINTYTAPVGKIVYLLTINCSGGNRGTYNIYNSGTLFDRQYAPVTNLSALFDYKTGSSSVPGMVIAVGNVITVTAVNNGSDSTMFNSRLMILEVG